MKKLLLLCLAIIVMAGLSASALPSATASATNLVTDAKCQDQTGGATCPVSCPDTASGATLTPEQLNAGCPPPRDCRAESESCNVVARYLNPLINAAAILVGIAVTVGIITGGIQYASSGGDPQKAATGKKHIKMAVIALIGFLFMYALLIFLVPGGSSLLPR